MTAPRPLVPPRFKRPGALPFAAGVAALAFVIWSFQSSGFSLAQFERGIPALMRVFGQMFPPNIADIGRILWSLLTTFQMAVAGVVLGLVFSLPIAILAAEGLSPHPVSPSCREGPDCAVSHGAGSRLGIDLRHYRRSRLTGRHSHHHD